MPDLSGGLEQAAQKAVLLASTIEDIQVRLPKPSTPGSKLTVAQLEMIYEISYLNFFCKWEDFLEQTFLRFLCGYVCAAGRMSLVTGDYSSTIADARATVLGGRDYKLWHSAATVIARSQRYFTNGRHESIIASHESRIEAFGKIRHHIAHEQSHARAQFDNSTMMLAGSRFQGSKAGKFLRSWTYFASGERVRWLELIATELTAIAKQIAI